MLSNNDIDTLDELAMKEHSNRYRVSRDAPLNAGEGMLYRLLSSVHDGVRKDDKIWLSIVNPITRDTNEILGHTQALLMVYARMTGSLPVPDFDDGQFYPDIRFLTDKNAILRWLEVPASWMEEV